MVTINNIPKSFIKRVCLTLSLFSVFNLFSQESRTLSENAIKRNFELKVFKNHYLQIPSLINKANISKFSYSKAIYMHSEGHLRHPQKYKNKNGLNFEVTSLSDLKNTNWTLYGSLEYLNTVKKDVETNLSYVIYNYNSPYYFFQKKEGLWNHQTYNFSVVGVNKISNKLSIGAQFNYKTNFYYRKSDTRNEKLALTMTGKLSSSYQISKNQIFSTSFGINFLKNESSFYNKFKENKGEPIYKIYFNTGLGSYIKTIKNGGRMNRKIYQIQMQWLHQKENYDLLLSSITNLGKERWIDKNIHLVNQNNVISKYSILNQKIKLFLSKKFDNRQISSSLIYNYNSGSGKYWSKNNKEYISNFGVSQHDLKVAFDVFFKNKFCNNIGLEIMFLSKDKNDNNYAYKFNNSFINFGTHIGLQKKITKKTTIFGKFGGAYKHILNVTHSPFAAKNLFVDWIANPIADYLNTSYFESNGKLGINIKLSDSSSLESGITANHFFATKSPSSILKNSSYLQFKLYSIIYF